MKNICALIGACLLASAIASLGLGVASSVRRARGASARDARTGIVLEAAAARRPARENPARSR